MKALFRYTALLFSFVLVTACGGGGGDDPAPPAPPQPPNSGPVSSCNNPAINLVFPLDGEECQEGEEEAGKILTPFRWSTQGGAGVTGLSIQNLTDNVAVSTDGLSLVSGVVVPLEFGKEYQWQVLGACESTNITSNPRTFTTQGPPNNNVAPYPAEIEIRNNANRRATIVWVAEDEDNEELRFQVFLDKNSNPTTLISNNITSPSGAENSLQRDFTSGGTYYVKIITEDTAGNQSTAIVSFDVL